MRPICLDCHTARMNSCHKLETKGNLVFCDAPFLKSHFKFKKRRKHLSLSSFLPNLWLMLLLSIHVHDWSYLTEGNAHLILNYTGNDAHLVSTRNEDHVLEC